MNLDLDHARVQGHPKVRPAHLERLAYVYVRQSTLKQVREHLESQIYQRRLAEQAVTLGWPRERIVTLDADLGQSGSHSGDRAGFQELVAELSLGRVGIVLSYEVSRLARNNRDWYHLLDLAAVFDTLIADSDGIYHPRLYNDRLLLGLKGTLSEAELHLLRQRLEVGRLNQVKRGEYRQRLPTGLVRLPDGTVVLNPDLQVQRTLTLVLDQFAKLGSSGKVVRFLRREGIVLPSRSGGSDALVLWRPASESAIREIVTNPAYAGCFAYGRRQFDPRRQREGHAQSGRVRRAPEDWIHLEQDRYPAYVSWTQYQANQEQLRRNATVYTDLGRQLHAQGALRQGEALLTGLVRCGHCGHRVVVHYRRDGDFSYRCGGLRRTQDVPACLSLNGPALDALVCQAFFAALHPAQLDALEAVLEGERQEHAKLAEHWKQRQMRAAYAVRLAERQYSAVDPENRLVSAELERRWEQALTDLHTVQDAHAHFERRPVTPSIDAGLRTQFQDLSRHLPQLWSSWMPQEQKAMLRTLIGQVVVQRSEVAQVAVRVVWVSGHCTALTLRPPILNRLSAPDEAALTDRIGTLWRQGLDDRTIARILSEEGYRPARSLEVKPLLVQRLRLQQRWLSAAVQIQDQTEHQGELTVQGLAQTLGVSMSWVYHHLQDGLIAPERRRRHPQGKVNLFPNDGVWLEQLRSQIGKRRGNRMTQEVVP